MKIKVDIINPHGFCGNPSGFGVQRAVHVAIETAKKNPGKTYLLGEIVHNQHVVDQLTDNYGIKTVHSLEEVPSDGIVVIRSHGTYVKTFDRIKEKGLKFVDATCPLVNFAHQEVKKLASQGKQIVYIASDLRHDEALGVASEAEKSVTLTTLEKINDLKINDPDNTYVLTQTTLSILETKEVLENLKEKYPTLTIKPHICPATTQRQQAVIDAAKNHEVIIVVGSPTSSNSNRLREVAEKAGAKAYVVDTAADLKIDWFSNTSKVAISSGASTPEDIFNQVAKTIEGFDL